MCDVQSSQYTDVLYHMVWAGFWSLSIWQIKILTNGGGWIEIYDIISFLINHTKGDAMIVSEFMTFSPIIF